MNLRLLPNWCKKAGVMLFLIAVFFSCYEGFMEGINGEPRNSGKYDLFTNYFGKEVMHWFNILSILGMIIYAFSKEKIEDDYINKLRLESYQITAIIGLAITIFLYAFSKNYKLSLDYFINIFLIIYLITFALKKRVY